MVNFNIISLIAASSFFLLTSSAPLDTRNLSARQIGDLQCNIDRLSIVGAIAQSKSALKSVASASNNTSTQNAVSTAQAGLKMATTAIEGIAKSIFTGQTAPASDRDMVLQGLNTAINATQSINTTTDTAAAPGVAKAKSALANSAKFGEDVIANCK